MRNIITFFSTMLFATSGFCQPITITASDLQIATQYAYTHYSSLSPSNPAAGTNMVWDYGNLTGGTMTGGTTPLATDPFFTSQGVDRTFDNLKNLGNNMTYNMTEEWDFSSTGLACTGYYFPQDITDLSFLPPYTTLDSIGIPEQKMMLSSPYKFIQTPYTINSCWKSVVPATVNMVLTLKSNGFNLDHVPMVHKYTIYRIDTCIGWGKMTVRTVSGPSQSYDVLMVRTDAHNIDSFFINGRADSTRVMDSLGIVQGQYWERTHYLNFYRQADFKFLMRFIYTDSLHTTMTQTIVNTTGVFPADVKNSNAVSYSSLVYPNPATSSEINIQLFGKDITEAGYTITDLQGRLVQQGVTTSKGNNTLQVPLAASIANGKYFISITSGKTSLVKEQIEVAR